MFLPCAGGRRAASARSSHGFLARDAAWWVPCLAGAPPGRGPSRGCCFPRCCSSLFIAVHRLGRRGGRQPWDAPHHQRGHYFPGAARQRAAAADQHCAQRRCCPTPLLLRRGRLLRVRRRGKSPEMVGATGKPGQPCTARPWMGSDEVRRVPQPRDAASPVAGRSRRYWAKQLSGRRPCRAAMLPTRRPHRSTA